MQPATRFAALQPRPVPSGEGRIERALLCADVVGFTHLTERLGDCAALDAMRGVAGVVRRTAEHHRGELVEIRGDSFLIAFRSTLDAVRCAIEIQREATRGRTRCHDLIQVRIALHMGPMILDGDGYFGLNVILPYRLLSQVGAGEIAVTTRAIESLPGSAQGWCRCASREGTFLPKGMRERTGFTVFDGTAPGLPMPRPAARAIAIAKDSSGPPVVGLVETRRSRSSAAMEVADGNLEASRLAPDA